MPARLTAAHHLPLTSTSTTPTGPTPRSPDSPRGGLGRQVSFTDPPSAPLSAGQPDTCLLADLDPGGALRGVRVLFSMGTG